MTARSTYIHIIFVVALSLNICKSQVLLASVASCVAQGSTSYFHVASLSCQQCVGIQIVSTDGMRCLCPSYAQASYTVPASTNSPALQCMDCSAQLTVATDDQQSCISCGNKSFAALNPNSTVTKTANCPYLQFSTPSTSSKSCQCPVGYVLTDYNSTGDISYQQGKLCVMCPYNSFVDKTMPSVCQRCRDALMQRDEVSGSCVCKSGYVEDSALAAGSSTFALGQFAQQTFYNVLDAGNSRTASVFVQRSLPFATYYVAAVTRCQAFRHSESCQALANLCVLTLYDKSHPACQAIQTMSSTVISSNVNGYSGWFQDLPWLFYQQILFVTSATSVDLTGDYSMLNLTLTAYALNGTFLGEQAVTTDLQLCPGDERALQRYQKIGTDYYLSCQIDLAELALQYPEPTFYELWANDPNTADGKTRNPPALYPVPIIIGNYQSSGVQPNIDLVNSRSIDLLDGSNPGLLNQLVMHRRFFLYDNWSGRKIPDSSTQSASGSRAQTTLQLQDIGVVRWASYMELRVQIQISSGSSGDTVGSTIPVNAPAVNDPASSLRFPTIVFLSTYLMDLSSFWNVTMILFIVLVILMIIFFGVKASVRNQNRSTLPLEWGMVLADALGTLADFFFWGLFIMCGYWFFFFKLQGKVKVLLPIQDPNPNYLAVVAVCIVAKILQVALLFNKQCNSDIFFMDWEKPKDPSDPSNVVSKGKEPELPNVSVWRNIMVANEWAEMQAERHTDIDFTLMFLLLFLAGLNYQYLATAQPNAQDLSPGATNSALRFFVIAMWYFTVIAIQLVYKGLAYRFKDDPLDTFVDLCQLANISVFILDEPAHGYYIHGRSVHPHSDVNMRTMLTNFKAESEGNLPFRGLTQQSADQLNGASDLVFEMYITADIRGEYSGMLNRIRYPEPRHAVMARRASDMKGSGGNAAVGNTDADVNARAYRAINEYLQRDVIEPVQTRGAAEIRRPTAWHRLLGFPPDQAKAGTGAVLLRDNRRLFARVLFYGIEYDLIVLDLLVYIMWDLIFADVFVAALLTYVVAHGLKEMRSRWGIANIARKTLVDSRLLI